MSLEYAELWKEAGIETILVNPLKRPVSQRKPARPPAPSYSNLTDVRSWLGECTRCGLCESRTSIVFGEGNSKARLLFVGEGPEKSGDGVPELLNKVIEAMGFKRDEVYLTNVVKCHPPENRLAAPKEIEECFPFLKAQIDLIQPEVIVALGVTAGRVLLSTGNNLSQFRGRFIPLPWNGNISVLATYPPSHLLKNPEAKKTVWEDMKLVMNRLKK